MSRLKEHPKVLGLVIASVVVLSAGVAVAYWPSEPPPMPETMEDVEALFASDRYASLSTQQRQPYQQRAREIMRESGWEGRRRLMANADTSDAAQQFMMDMFEQRMKEMSERARQFALASEAERRRMIAEDLAKGGGRGGFGGPPRGERGEGQRGEGQRGGERGDRPDDGQGPSEDQRNEMRAKVMQRIEQMVNEGNGQDQALMREYRQAVREAREKQQAGR